jgi:Spy/CpxP family protein refolding chaperone
MRTFLLSICAAVLAMTASAQIPTPSSGLPAQPPSRLEFLTNYLSLTTSQQAQAQTIFNAEDGSTRPLMAGLQQAQSALTAADKQGQSDSALDQLAAAVGGYSANIASVHAKAEKQFYAILAADQQAKYDKLTSGLNLGNLNLGNN